MLRTTLTFLAALLLAAPGLAESDELTAVPAGSVDGHPYRGDGAPSEIHFINARAGPVNLLWIDFTGARRYYGTIRAGEEWFQPTFVSHRWLVTAGGSGVPVAAFISTRSTIHDDGSIPIALIR